MANGAAPVPSESAASDSTRPPHRTVAAPSTGGLVVVRDEHGAVSVMHCLPDELIVDPGFQQAYRAESAALAALGEPRLAEPLSYIMDASGRIVAVVRRHFPGITLGELLTQGGVGRALDTQAAATVVSDVLVALDALHRRGVAHRRLDAQQVIVSRSGECVVVGAGLAARPQSSQTGGADLGAAMAFDLAAVVELFALCVASGRASGRDPVTHSVYTALTEARHAPVDRWEQGSVAAEMLAALEAAAEQFGAGWRERGHEKLASCARALHKPRGARAERARDEGGPRPTALITRSALLHSAAPEAAGTGRRAVPRSATATWWRRVAAITVPLIALLLAFALMRGAFSSPAPKTPPPPSLAVVTGAQGDPAGAQASAVAETSPGPSRSPSPHRVTAVAASATALTRVTSLSIADLGFTAPASDTATVVVDTGASGPATVNVAVTIAQNGPQGPSSRTDHFVFSGQRQYTLSDNFPAMLCSSGGATQVVATVTVSATVPSTNAAPATASGNLYSMQCG